MDVGENWRRGSASPRTSAANALARFPASAPMRTPSLEAEKGTWMKARFWKAQRANC
jgi:hypothetical protein